MSLSKRIRDLRYAKGWGPDDLAAQAGLSRTALYNIERERTRHPHANTVRQIAEALQVPIEALYDANPRESGDARPRRRAKGAKNSHRQFLSAERRWEVEGKFLEILGSPLADGIALLVEESYHLLQRKKSRNLCGEAPPSQLPAPVDTVRN